MAGGEGKVCGPGNQEPDRGVDVTETDTGNKGVQEEVTADRFQSKTDSKNRACPACFRECQQAKVKHDPDGSAVPQACDHRHPHI
nr:hypothetical protein [uncultured Oscillibacter sp.]